MAYDDLLAAQSLWCEIASARDGRAESTAADLSGST
jgi:hypothetical protein